jgi:hypothetical protein
MVLGNRGSSIKNTLVKVGTPAKALPPLNKINPSEVPNNRSPSGIGFLHDFLEDEPGVTPLSNGHSTAHGANFLSFFTKSSSVVRQKRSDMKNRDLNQILLSGKILYKTSSSYILICVFALLSVVAQIIAVEILSSDLTYTPSSTTHALKWIVTGSTLCCLWCVNTCVHVCV